MNEEDVPQALAAALEEYSDEDTSRVADLVARWPDFRRAIAYTTLAHAVALADTFGCDVEGFIAELRRVCPKPPELVPPTGNDQDPWRERG